MAARSDAALAAILLSQRLVDTGVPPLKASEYWALLDAVKDPSQLLGSDSSALAGIAGVDAATADRIAGLFDAATAVAFAVDELEQSGVQVISSVDDGYPVALKERLGASAPPLLYVAGDARLLDTELLGVVGSRDVAEGAARVAEQAAQAAVEQGLGVVSGGAKGVDRLAMEAALRNGGTAVGVLADSLVRVTRDPEVRRAVTDGQLCLCTPYKPTAGFSVANAMGRNKVIYALSAATFVVATDVERGGTWAGAVEALKRGIAPVLVWTGEGAGIGGERLAELGGEEVTSLSRLFPLPERQAADPTTSADQLALDV